MTYRFIGRNYASLSSGKKKSLQKQGMRREETSRMSAKGSIDSEHEAHGLVFRKLRIDSLPQRMSVSLKNQVDWGVLEKATKHK